MRLEQAIQAIVRSSEPCPPIPHQCAENHSGIPMRFNALSTVIQNSIVMAGYDKTPPSKAITIQQRLVTAVRQASRQEDTP